MRLLTRKFSENITGPTSIMYRKLLSWNYISLIKFLNCRIRCNTELGYRIPECFYSLDTYLDNFENLVLEECISNIYQGSNDVIKDQHTYGITLPSKGKCQGFLTVKFLINGKTTYNYSNNDLIILSKDRMTNNKKTTDSSNLNIFGVVIAKKNIKEFTIKFYLDKASQTGSFGGKMRVNLARNLLSSQTSEWFLTKLFNLSTISREYESIRNVRYIPFIDYIMKGKSEILSPKKWKLQNIMRSIVESSYNFEQAEAIMSGTYGSPIVLIQGPPGTGKTRTILGIIEIALQMGSIGYLKQLRKCNILQIYLSKKINYQKKVKNAQILVCAPSNSALDEIMLRTLDKGLFNPQSKLFIPRLVRVGLNIHSTVMKVSLKYLIDTEIFYIKSDGKIISRIDKEKYRVRIIQEANIVFTTLSFSGSSIFSQVVRLFEILIVDEASQAVEPSALIPLCQGILQIYLVGDPSQLPATVISSFAIERGYNMGLFSRLMRAGYPIQRLKIQYRMHPLIREYPSTAFYGGLLQDGENIEKQTNRPWHFKRCFGPLSFYDVRGHEEKAIDSVSIFKEYEAQLSVEIFLFLTNFYPSLRLSSQFGIISPYKDQVSLIKRKISEALGGLYATRNSVDINTIDGFQGKEKDLVIFSSVRSKLIKDKCFITDERRLNVGLTRARSSIIVLGHARSLSYNSSWRSLIEHCRDRNVLYKIKHIR